MKTTLLYLAPMLIAAAAALAAVLPASAEPAAFAEQPAPAGPGGCQDQAQ